jgi:dTMP kinase
VALEGVDGSGKSTQARRLASSLGALLTFEPGATALGRALRELLLGGDHPAPVGRAEALLMAADRAQHVEEVIRPALERGRWVVTDRFSGSTLAYQGHGRGLGLEVLGQLVLWAAGGTVPDLTVLIDVPASVARRRLEAVAPDRLERLDASFFSRVREGYLALAAGDPGHWVVIDGDAAPDAVAVELLTAVTTRLGGRRR